MHVRIASVANAASVATSLNKREKIVKLEIRVNSCNIGLEMVSTGIGFNNCT